jgi:hypothetical protein
VAGLAQIHHLRDGSVDLTFPYDAGFISRLKDEIPHSARTYDPATKVWTIYPPYAAYAADLMHAAFAAVVEYGEGRDDTSSTDSIRRDDPDFAILHLLPSAPPELVEAAYRCLAKRCHPDTGGEHAVMLRLNEAVVRLRERQEATV